MGTRAAPFDALAVADIGDVATNPYNLADSIRLITEHYTRVLGGGCKPLTLGGDHTIALPILRAIAAKHGPVGLVHVDAHADVNDNMFGEPIAHGTPFRRAVEEGLLDCKRVVQIGLRGTGYAADDFDWPRQQGFRVVQAEECWYKSLAPLMAEVREQLGRGPVYITFDIDGLDPSVAPRHRHAGDRRAHGLAGPGNHPRLPRAERRRRRPRGGLAAVRSHRAIRRCWRRGCCSRCCACCPACPIVETKNNKRRGGRAMKVTVLGAGIVGVTTAYQLQKDGHEVTVIDRQPIAANETSFGNAGMIAPGHSYTWASPKAPGILFRSLFQRDQALRLTLRADPQMWSWCLRFLRNCTAERAAANTKEQAPSSASTRRRCCRRPSRRPRSSTTATRGGSSSSIATRSPSTPASST